MSSTLHRPGASSSSRLDTITASLVARQSRTDDGSMSVPDQIDAMRDFCARQTPPWIIGGVYEERDVSGRRPLERRHGLKRAVVDVEKGRSQIVLTAYFDRYVRSVTTRAEVVDTVEQHGGQVVTLDMGRDSNATAAQWLSGTMLAAIAEFYARQTGEKLVVSKQRNIDRGVPPFPRITCAYLRREDGTLTPDPTNAPLIAKACHMRADGKSFLAIQRWLAGEGLVLSLTAVRSTLHSKLLIGEIHFGSYKPNRSAGEFWGGVVIDRTTFRAMQRRRIVRGRYSKSDRLLARQGVLVCETCGSRMTVHSSTGKGGTRYPYYVCNDRLCSAGASISASVADDAVRDAAIKLAGDAAGHASAAAELEAARLRLDEAEQTLQNAIRSLLGLEAEVASREVLDELTAARDLAADEHRRLVAIVTPDLTVRTADDWLKMTLDEQREVIRAVVERAVVAPGRGADRLTIVPR